MNDHHTGERIVPREEEQGKKRRAQEMRIYLAVREKRVNSLQEQVRACIALALAL